MNKPLISIIIPCYGVEKYLDRCIESIVNQTLKNIEIILIDDKSPDKVPQICDDWAIKDERIKVIHKKKNEGLGFARNTGLEIANGDYVAFVDSDDYIDITMYETLFNKAEENGSDIVYCGIKQEIRKGLFTEIRDFDKVEIFEKCSLVDLSINYIDPQYGRCLFMSVWHSIYKRNKIGNLRFYSERVVCSEDLPFQIGMLLRVDKVTYIPNALYYYCFNEGSLSKTFNFEKCFKYYTLTKILKDYYPKSLEYHIWRFYFNYCIVFIRALIRSKNARSVKVACLKNLCNNKEILCSLMDNKMRIMQCPKNHLASSYMFAITNNFVGLLYGIALFDIYIICDKLGLKNCKQ